MGKNIYNVLVLRVLLSSFLLFVVIAGFAGDSKYSVQYGISYYEDSIANSDSYIKERCVLDIYYPENQKDFPTVIWFHGGGINSGNKWIPGELKDRGVAVIAVNYRLSPMVKCPAYLEDAAAAVAWTFKNIERFGGDPSKIIVSGHSAGGYLASMIGLDKKWLADFGIDANEIALLVPFSGHTITHLTIRKERGISDTQPIVDEFAPLFHIRPDAPPMVLILGDRELEMLGRYEENAYFRRMMKVIGHDKIKLFELDGFDHGGMLEPAFLLLQKEIEFFVKQQNQ